jgi:hypothetical protein
MTLKIVVVAAIPSARVSMATAAKPGFFASILRPKRTSCQTLVIGKPRKGWMKTYSSASDWMQDFSREPAQQTDPRTLHCGFEPPRVSDSEKENPKSDRCASY